VLQVPESPALDGLAEIQVRLGTAKFLSVTGAVARFAFGCCAISGTDEAETASAITAIEVVLIAILLSHVFSQFFRIGRSQYPIMLDAPDAPESQ
jgi:hypothetical protein